MASDIDRYIKALTAYRGDREAEWSASFAQTAVAAASAAVDFGGRLATRQEEWLVKAGVRRGSTAEKIIEALPAQPMIDVAVAARLAGTSEEAARQPSTSWLSAAWSSRSPNPAGVISQSGPLLERASEQA